MSKEKKKEEKININKRNERKGKVGLIRLIGFYGISTFVGYLTPNPFL